MRSRFIAENRWLLRLCAQVARFCGLLLLLGTGVLVAVMVVFSITMSEGSNAPSSRSEFLSKVPALLFYGFVALILAEFISYLLAEQGEPKWILRHGDKVIYAYVLYSLAVFVRAAPQAVRVEGASGMDLLGLALLVASGVVHGLIWVGLAIVLRKVVPIVRESKTLV